MSEDYPQNRSVLYAQDIYKNDRKSETLIFSHYPPSVTHCEGVPQAKF